MRLFAIGFAGLAFICFSTAFAQSADQNIDQNTDAQLALDAITVEGIPPVYGTAMTAFRSGDFKTAEVEFVKVFERSKFGQSRVQETFALNQNIALAAQSAPPPGTSAPVQTGTSAAIGVVPGDSVRRSQSQQTVLRRQDLGFPLYMAGLSQIQLGHYEKAQNSFRSALRYNNALYDARIRLGLLAIENNEAAEARKQLRSLRKLARRCERRCHENVDLAELTNGIMVLTGGLAGLQGADD